MSREHIGFPFGSAPSDQDSAEEIRDCALVALSYRPGQRPGNRAFGCQPTPHRQGGVDLAALEVALNDHDERIAPVVTGNDPALLALLRRTNVLIQTDPGS